MSSEREAPVSERVEHLKQRIDKWRRGILPTDALDGILDQVVMLLSALPPVRAQEPSCQGCLHAFESHCNGAAMQGCYDVAPDGSRCGCDSYVPPVPPVQATTAEAEPRYCQKCGSNAIRTVEPGLFVCDWCDAVMRDKSSPLRETTRREPMCGVQSEAGWQCTQKPGHKDLHRCTVGQTILDEWPQGESSPLRETPAPSATDTECPPDCHCRKETPAPDLARVRALLEQWRSEAANVQNGRDYGYGLRMVATALSVCADQLSAALEGASPQETK